jgi:aryl-alcohol dehydrogenase-like predicted oxidoreductase
MEHSRLSEGDRMPSRRIGGYPVSAIGFGAMWLSLGDRRPDRRHAIQTVHAALDAGIRLIDTADAYCLDATELGHNERLVAEALSSWPGDSDEVLVATKGGHVRDTEGGWGLNGRPEYLRLACERSLRALGVEAIGLYQYHRPDPETPWEDTMGALAELRREGKIRLVGVSNADEGQIRTAVRICDLAAVQNEFSPGFRSSATELRLCDELGIAFLPWRPLGGIDPDGPFAAIAGERGVSPQRVALAWELAQAEVVVPIPGATRPSTIRDSAAAADLELTAAELRRLDAG